jgi:hypothetical protein
MNTAQRRRSKKKNIYHGGAETRRELKQNRQLKSEFNTFLIRRKSQLSA